MHVLDSQCSQYHQQLLDSTEGLEWHSNRGLNEETISKFKLGWITEPLSPTAVSHVGNPVIPYITLSGRVIELRVRRLEGKPKYLRIGHYFPIPMAKKTHLFNAKHAVPTLRSAEVHICEGEYDCMIAVQCGLRAVAVPGSINWNPVWTNLLSASSVVIALDADAGGAAGVQLLEREFSQRRIDYRTVTLPTGCDITDLYLAGGAAAVKESLAG